MMARQGFSSVWWRCFSPCGGDAYLAVLVGVVL
jgi:hypothetical protein